MSAHNGVAYGVIGADLHVLGDGRPLYQLSAYETRQTRPAGWREQPSRLLDPAHQAVPFTGRHHDFERLVAWRDDDTAGHFSALWLHGAGGQGKTRIAAELAQASAVCGWQVVVATHAGEKAPRPDGSQDLRAAEGQGLLMLVDYADRWPPSHLSWLFTNMLLHQPRPTRLLLVARSASVWAVAASDLETRCNAHTADHLLAPLNDGRGERAEMYRVALTAFAHQYGVKADRLPEPDTLGSDPDYGLPLTVHMAALAAVDAHAHGESPPGEVTRLSAYLLKRERRRWQHLYENRVRADDPAWRNRGGIEFATPPTLLARATFTAILTGASSNAAAVDLLSRAGVTGAQQVVDDHRLCYPPADRATVLEPLRPDRLAEDFLALLLPGHEVTDHVPDPWAAELVTVLLGSGDSGQRPSPHADRAVLFLAGAAGRWPHVGSSWLYPLLLRNPGLALAAGSAALTALASIDRQSGDGNTDPQLLAVWSAIERQLSAERDTDLDVGAADIISRLTPHRLAAGPTLIQKVRLHSDLGNRLFHAGRNDESLHATAEAVAVSRQLAQRDAAALPTLALLLSNLSGVLFQQGRLDEALTTARESTKTIGSVSADGDGLQQHIFANALNAISVVLATLGDHVEALTAAQAAVDLCRHLVVVDRKRHLPDLAAGLGTLGVRLEAAGHGRQALAVLEQAADLWRELASDAPQTHDPALLGALSNLGMTLNKTGRRQEGMHIVAEALMLARRLAAANPASHRPALDATLTVWAQCLSDQGRHRDAAAAMQESVDLCRAAGAGHPVWQRSLGRSLSGLSGQLAAVDRIDDAVTAGEEAVSILRLLNRTQPATVGADLAAALHDFGNALARAGRLHEAVAAAEEGVALRRVLAAREPEVHADALALALSGLGIHLHALKRAGPALPVAEEAAALYRELISGRNPDPYLTNFAIALKSLAAIQQDLSADAAALETLYQAVGIFRHFNERYPAAYLPHVNAGLTALTLWLLRLNRHTEALPTSRLGLEVARQMVEIDAVTHTPDLVDALQLRGNVLSALAHKTEAAATVVEAVRLLRLLAEQPPGRTICHLDASLLTSVHDQLDAEVAQDAMIITAWSLNNAWDLLNVDPGNLEDIVVAVTGFAHVRINNRMELVEALIACADVIRIVQERQSEDLNRYQRCVNSLYPIQVDLTFWLHDSLSPTRLARAVRGTQQSRWKWRRRQSDSRRYTETLAQLAAGVAR